MNKLNSLKFSLFLIDKVVVKFWLYAHNGVVGVSGSNPVVPTLLVGINVH